MKKNDDSNTNTQKIDAKKAKLQKKLEAEKLKKQKLREAKKAKRLKIIEKRKAKAAAKKAKREAKKAKRLAKLEKIKAKKAAQKAKKQALRQKKLERLAKQRAKEKELKLKAKEKAKQQKLKEKAKQQNVDAKSRNPVNAKNADLDIKTAVNAIKAYVKSLAKDAIGIDEKQIKKLQALGFTFNDDAIAFTFEAKTKASNAAKRAARKPRTKKIAVQDKADMPDPEHVEAVSGEKTIDEVIAETVNDEDAAMIEALADDIDEDASNESEIPAGDTFTDDVPQVNDQSSPDGFIDDEDDDTIDDHRDENDEDKIEFRHDWNNEFNDDGERNENW